MSEEAGAPPQEQLAVAMMRGLAEKISTNFGNGFAGAFVIVPPAGDAKELLLLNNTGDLAVFWSLLKTTADMALSDLADKDAQGWPGRR